MSNAEISATGFLKTRSIIFVHPNAQLIRCVQTQVYQEPLLGIHAS